MLGREYNNLCVLLFFLILYHASGIVHPYYCRYVSYLELRFPVLCLASDSTHQNIKKRCNIYDDIVCDAPIRVHRVLVKRV